ncbi:MFS transporter [Metarhizium album ARSEF 1941]|uniref:MFS transporter n=1 Tax=Metarhizium album (strain ARSEF 1941) TaxID=1081103 RepID=A0A0B2X5H5_METAS|nr:MFS transporter [Metarhizium album ARSEF 1941]KHO01634.1 MFS transporter [Metarhizium album ARSEF 1941]
MIASTADVEAMRRDADETDQCPKDNLYNDSTAVVEHAAERSLCFKFDVRILPVLVVMYLFNVLDKSNLSNAQTNGLSRSKGAPQRRPTLLECSALTPIPTELNFQPGQYNLVASIFFVPYVVFAPLIAMLGKKYGPARALSVMMVGFGSITLFGAACQNFSGIFAVRWFLGMTEAAFLPVTIYYLTTFYRRGELARRLAVFYAASNVASAFSGMLAFGVFHIHGELYPWRYLFLIEGSATVLFAVFAFWYLPKSASESQFLNEEEKALAFHRMQIDSSSAVSEKFSFKEALHIFRYPSSYAFLAMECCLGVPLQSVSLFLPQIIQRLGYSTVKTNLYTVAPSIAGATMLILMAFASDYTRVRFPFIVLGLAFALTGFIIFASITDIQAQIQVAYFATFMMCWGASAPSVLLSTWYNNNIAHEGRRVALTSVGVPMANVMGLVASNVFQQHDAPKYTSALITTACFGVSGVLLACPLGLYMIFDNNRRDRKAGVKVKAGDVPTLKLRDGPDSPEFRWYL